MIQVHIIIGKKRDFFMTASDDIFCHLIGGFFILQPDIDAALQVICIIIVNDHNRLFVTFLQV